MPKKSKTLPLSEAQREIMDIVWDRGEVSVADVRETLAKKRRLARNTVQTLIVRMEDKGWLKHRTIGRTFVYSAVQPRKTTLGQKVRELIDTTFGGSAEELVTALLEGRGLTQEEATRIRDMIDRAELRKTRRKGNPS